MPDADELESTALIIATTPATIIPDEAELSYTPLASFLVISKKLRSSTMSLRTFPEMWYQIFLWALFSSIFVHTIAAAVCFITLRKHKYGKFFPLVIFVMGVFMPLTSGIVSSAAIAFVYISAGLEMSSLYAMLWGAGQTVLAAGVGCTRILATL